MFTGSPSTSLNSRASKDETFAHSNVSFGVLISYVKQCSFVTGR